VGPANEATQKPTFVVTNDNNSLFTTQPKIAANGTLTYKPATDAFGTANVTIVLQDDSGTANGGVNTAPPQVFTILITNINDAPSFIKGPDQSVVLNAGPQTVAGWATAITAGPNEASQALNFVVTTSNNNLFFILPSVSSNGTLTYTPATGVTGVATVSVTLRDNGGTANGGKDFSGTATFKITVTSGSGLAALMAPPQTSRTAEPDLTVASLNAAIDAAIASETNSTTRRNAKLSA
jgi:large repetitive protein